MPTNMCYDKMNAFIYNKQEINVSTLSDHMGHHTGDTTWEHHTGDITGGTTLGDQMGRPHWGDHRETTLGRPHEDTTPEAPQ